MPLTSAARLPAPQSGRADMGNRTTAWTHGRETADELNFAAINFHDSRGFTLRKSLRVERAAGLQGASICVAAGSINGLNLSDWARVNNIRNPPIVFEQKDEIRNTSKAGCRDACCTDASQPTGPRASFPDAEEHAILTDIIRWRNRRGQPGQGRRIKQPRGMNDLCIRGCPSVRRSIRPVAGKAQALHHPHNLRGPGRAGMSLIWTRRALGGATLALPFIRTVRAQQSIEWVAGSLGGGWYTMAAGLAALIKDENPDIQIRVVPGGGLANSTRVNNGQSPIGWGIDAFAASAFKGEEPYSAKHTHLRCLGSGYSPTEHNFLRRADGGPEDMRSILTQKGLRLACTQRSSTDEMTLQRIMRFIGTSVDRIRSEGGRYLNGSYSDIGAAFSDGQVDYLYVALARPAALLTEISQGRRAAKLVAFPADVRKHLIDRYAYAEGVIPVGTYPALQTADVPVTTMDSTIMVHESLPEDIAYRITRTLIRNKGQRLVTIHASMGAWDPATSWKYQGLPLHPGAARAFREAGVMPA